jgi:diguanylate cyclase
MSASTIFPRKTIFGMSFKGWRKVIGWSVSGTLGCILFSVTFNFFVFRDMGEMAFARGITVAVILPVLLAGPLFFYLTMKMRELAKVNHQLNDLATKDPGTGLLNRRALIARVNEESAKMAFAKGVNHLFLVVDADRFKLINDKFGHTSGDEALILIAKALSNAIRHYDLVGRIGGEEFALSLPNVSIEDAHYITDRLRRSVAASVFRPRGVRHDLSVSIGGVIYDEPMAFTALFKAADANLYFAKAQGRNCSVITHVSDVALNPQVEPAVAHPGLVDPSETASDALVRAAARRSMQGRVPVEMHGIAAMADMTDMTARL